MRLPFLILPFLAAACSTRPAPETPASPPPASRAVPDAQLRETRWVLRQLAGQPVAVPADTREAYLTLRADGTAEGNGSCNRFRGSFFSEKPGELTFTPLMSTRMSCPAIATENAFTGAMAQARSYRISGDTLRVLDANGAAVARLEAVYLH
ncbi:META domain-containing protein [Hymenobacter convexus]|uniref:META domain-containing protein n=1 Tax=Hymenobacter sp. CA1UV-4 TaxID=3063782 RepID=UPI0027127CCC|nr:META domain-containing protein [Hymenobacter sp. CA1UV-4]MDO7851950.1 META domain-containing protein [Hymenobacter sp. CA1UV-4]